MAVALVVSMPAAGKRTIGSSETTARGSPSLVQSVTIRTIIATMEDWAKVKKEYIPAKASIPKNRASTIFFVCSDLVIQVILPHAFFRVSPMY